MSFIDLAALTFHRRNEMEARVNTFLERCDHATREIVKLKVKAKGLLQLLNCDPADLKTQFLAGMKQLDELNYLITDFNLLVDSMHDNTPNDITPVQDVSYKPTPNQSNYNLMDALIEPTPSKPTICSNHCTLDKLPHRKIKRSEQTLIAFSSQSCSSESVPQKQEQEVQTKLSVSSMTLKDTPPQVNLDAVINLPAQEVLQSDKVYAATIISIDGYSFWVIIDDVDEVYQLMTDMTEFYNTHQITVSPEDITNMTYCAFYDEESKGYYRGFFISVFKEDSTKVEVFLVDTGEIRVGESEHVQPLLPTFCLTPPHARCCHLAGVSLLDLPDKVEPFMQNYCGKQCHIEIDDNSSESLGVYVILDGDNLSLNELIVMEGLATRIVEKPTSVCKSSKSSHGPPEFATNDDDEDFETEDALVAVTGYHNRDEIDLCKHYKGGPEKTCFKGTRCKKRHALIHPDGWTLDRVGVVAKCKSLPLPAPGTWHKVHVTCVYHFDRVYVQYIHNNKDKETTVPEFGLVLPPTTLDSLVRDMNCSATVLAYKPLRLSPAPGELVAAMYPLDEQWYRARVLSLSRHDQTVEVIFIDYGNVLSVKENQVRQLEERFVSLPMQAVRCVLGGVTSISSDSRQWAAAKKHLNDMTLTNVFDMHVLGREYDELIVKLVDRDSFDVAQILAAKGFVNYSECKVIDDTKVKRKTIPA